PAGVGTGDADGGARLAGLLLADEDVEVTSFALAADGRGGHGPDGRSTVDRAKTVLQETDVADARSVVAKADGRPADAILEEAQRGYDLLVLATREHRTRDARTLFGPEIDDVIQESPCSLLVLSASPEGTIDTDRLTGGHILV